jgi:hypothetical protein
MLALLSSRSPASTACPSEVARAACAAGSDAWRGWMDAVRGVARRLAEQGRVVIKQRGAVVPPEEVGRVRGPIRLGLVRGES